MLIDIQQLPNSTQKNKKKHSQFYTTPNLGKILISLVPTDNIYLNVIDLSAGEGALLNASLERFPAANLYAFDIDKGNRSSLSKINKCSSVIIDSTTKHALLKANSLQENYCLALGNPPFKAIEPNEHIKTIFSYYNLPINEKKIRAEVFFLLLSLYILKDNGIAAFILPDGVISSSSSSNLREVISKKFNILNIMEISAGEFSGTEAKTHIIILKKSPPLRKIKISHWSTPSKTINISIDDFIFRGDYRFYNENKKNKKKAQIQLEIIRGNISGHQAKNKKHIALHTTSFINDINLFSNNTPLNTEGVNKNKIASPGDIVIPRVGSRSLGKIGLIESGFFFVSDCMFILRTEKIEIREKIFTYLSSDAGKKFIRSIAKGVGAQYLTLEDLNHLKGLF